MCYICSICMWEIDLFIKNEDEASDLSLRHAKENFKEFGVVLERLGSVLSKG